MRVNRRRDSNDLGLIGGVDQKNTGYARMPFGDRASLIDSERLKLTNGLQERATFDEDPYFAEISAFARLRPY